LELGGTGTTFLVRISYAKTAPSSRNNEHVGVGILSLGLERTFGDLVPVR